MSNDKEKVYTSKTGQKYIINTPKTSGGTPVKTPEQIKQQAKELKK